MLLLPLPLSLLPPLPPPLVVIVVLAAITVTIAVTTAVVFLVVAIIAVVAIALAAVAAAVAATATATLLPLLSLSLPPPPLPSSLLLFLLPLPPQSLPPQQAKSRVHDAQMELKGAIHAAMERLLNGSCIGVTVATGPRGAMDLNAIEEHQVKPILVHPNKGSRENTAIGQGRALRREIRHHDVVCHNVDQKRICIFYVFLAVQHFFC
jgi:hypothetical protein